MTFKMSGTDSSKSIAVSTWLPSPTTTPVAASFSESQTCTIDLSSTAGLTVETGGVELVLIMDVDTIVRELVVKLSVPVVGMVSVAGVHDQADKRTRLNIIARIVFLISYIITLQGSKGTRLSGNTAMASRYLLHSHRHSGADQKVIKIKIRLVVLDWPTGGARKISGLLFSW
jgi:hypothetical protein